MLYNWKKKNSNKILKKKGKEIYTVYIILMNFNCGYFFYFLWFFFINMSF